MNTGLAVWFGLTVLIGLVWLRRHWQLNQARREPVLRPADAEGGTHWPAVSVLVAAKDEEANIGRCLAGLRRQDYPDFELIAINDRSRDRTPAILDALAAQDPRLRALHVDTLPEGWFGKNNAMRTGVAQARGQWLCFTDADCTFESDQLLKAAVRVALRDEIAFLSVLPELEAHTAWERIIQPVAGAVLVFWFPPHRVNDPRSSCAYANGAFMLMSRAAYAAIGGHAAARDLLNEDMHFARRAKQAGVCLRVVRGAGMYRVRMYTGLRQIWRGWSRIFYGCFGTFPRLLVSALMLSIFSVSPYVTLLASLLAGAAGWWLAGAAGLAIAGQQSILLRYYALAGTPRGWALTYPLGALFCLGMTLNAMLRLAGVKTTWRGTVYRGGAIAQSERDAGAQGPPASRNAAAVDR